MAAVYAAIHVTAPGSRTGLWRRIVWLAAPAAILGGGSWTAHDFGLRVFGSQILYHHSTALVVTLAAVVSSTVAIRMVKRKNAVPANAAQFETLAEAIPQIIWIADSSGRTTYINKCWFQMTGTSEQDAADDGWINQVHPDDREPLSEKWQACVQSGDTFEIEYRLHDAAQGYRWYLDRAVPLPDDQGVIQQWFGTCTDIEAQKHYQQLLEQQIRERTEELADTNTRLQQEMWEKDLARRTLDEQNEEMMQTLKERSQRATLLAKMGELLQSCQAREEVFTSALGFAPRIFPSRRGAVALFNPSQMLLKLQVSGTTVNSR
jgi:PAS domain S-box-containing protein